MRAPLFLIAALLLLFAASVARVPAAWFFVLPFFGLFPMFQRLTLLTVAGAGFDVFSSHAMGMAMFLFVGYGIALEYFRNTIGEGGVAAGVVLGAFSAALSVAFFILRGIELSLHGAFVPAAQFRGAIVPLLAVLAGTVFTALFLSWQTRRERSTHAFF